MENFDLFQANYFILNLVSELDGWLCYGYNLEIWWVGAYGGYLNEYGNPNLPDPMNFVPFGTTRYSLFAINLINIHEKIIWIEYLSFCLFLNKA